MIGKAIYALLSDSDALKEKIGESIFAVVAKENSPMPYLTYAINMLEPEFNKLAVAEDAYLVAVQIRADSYFLTQDVALLVRRALDGQKGFIGESGIMFRTCRMISTIDIVDKVDKGIVGMTQMFLVKTNPVK